MGQPLKFGNGYWFYLTLYCAWIYLPMLRLQLIHVSKVASVNSDGVYHRNVTRASWLLRLRATRMFSQHFFSGYHQRNIMGPQYWPLWRKSTSDRWIPPQRTSSNAESVSISWRHHVYLIYFQAALLQTSIPAWINNYMTSRVWDEISYPFPTVEVWDATITPRYTHFTVQGGWPASWYIYLQFT